MTGNKTKTEAEARLWRTVQSQNPRRVYMAEWKFQIDHFVGSVKGQGLRKKDNSCSGPNERR